jgi:cytochrome c oxidase assembly factor CtaG
MDPITDAVFRSWELNPWVLIPTFLIGFLYARGWRQLYRRAPHRFGLPHLMAFYAGLITILVALLSPLDAFAGWLLTVHMIQHLLLMMVAPPLILYGAPYLPLLAGLPLNFVKNGVAPFLASPMLRKVGSFVAHPVFCWSAFIFTSLAWHVPPMYELALRSTTWHTVEHICFVTTALLFWWPIIQPWPWVARVPRWTSIPYLFVADFQNTALSAFLMFYERVLYPTYDSVPRITGMTALEDQAAAGAIMWVAGSIFFLIPTGLITIEVLSSRRTSVPHPRERAAQPRFRQREKKLPAKRDAAKPASLDLFSLPIVGPILGWPHFRRVAQGLMFLLALIIIIDGFFGPQIGPMNLAGVMPWTHWRGLSVIALLAVGNILCMACPFTFVRNVGRCLLPAGWASRWSWPRRLRSKWIAITLLFIFFWGYEAFGLWDSPRWTSWMVVGYFAAALIVDGLFKGASFCKYVCPIGQYQFIQSLISPVEVGVRSLEVCRSCTTHDCLRGNENQRGCELQLFQPQKSNNMDCTFCLDCVHACPHQNVSLLASRPGTQLVRIQRRKRSLRWFRRFDGAVLIFLLAFAAFVNAGSMVGSVQAWEQAVQSTFRLASMQTILFFLYLFTLVVVPALLVASCVWLARLLSGRHIKWRVCVSTFAQSFVPLGLSMWLAHFSYHLLNGALTALPVIQRAATDVGVTILGKPDWSLSSAMLELDWLPSLQLLWLGVGLLFTLYVGWRLACSFRLRFARTLGLLAPWAVLALVLYSAGIWIVFQPMQMRGMMMDGTNTWCVSR